MSNESKCPVMHSSHARGTIANQQWWPNQLNLKMLHQNPPTADPMGEDFNYAEAFQTLDLEAVKQDIYKVMTTSQGLVARRLRALWTPLHSDGVAQCRHIPHWRWTRRRCLWHTPFCTPQQLARQRQSRQVSTAPLARQTEVWKEPLVGRPDHLRRELCLGVDGA